MATLLDNYKNKQDSFNAMIAKNELPLDCMLALQEVKYRICVFETMRNFCQTAPVTMEAKVMGYHYQLVNAYLHFLLTEHKFGPKVDENGQKKRETAAESLARVITDQKKRFSNYHPVNQEQYKRDIGNMINSVLAVWTQYRDAYITITL